MAQNNNPQSKIKVKYVRGTDYLIDFKSEPLGSGCFGVVRKAYNLKDRTKKLCCKIIPLKNEKSFFSAKNELNMLGQLPYNQHLVNIEKIKFNTRDDQYFFMEYCDGGNLKEYIQANDQLSEIEILDFLYQFIQGYSVLHKAKMVHRDLKPDNILIHKKCYKIADFGLATLIEFENQEVAGEGNFMMRAPELFPLKYRDKQYQNEIDYSKVCIDLLVRKQDIRILRQFYQQQIDMFSLGCILYNMIYKDACHPYLGLINEFFGNYNGNIQQFLCEGINRSSEIKIIKDKPCSMELIQLVGKLCEKDIQKRMSFNELVENDLPYKYMKMRTECLKESNIFDSRLFNLSILHVNRESQIDYLYPQPQIDISQAMNQLQNLDIGSSTLAYKPYESSILCSNIKQKVDFTDYDGVDDNDSINIGIDIYNEAELNLKLEEMEQCIERLDADKQMIFTIFDRCFYFREIVYFFDKVQLHIDTLSRLIASRMSNQMEEYQKKLLFPILDNLNCLRGNCMNEAYERTIYVYDDLSSKFNKSQIIAFKSSSEFEKFEFLRMQDLKQLDINLNSFTGHVSAKLDQNLVFKCLKDFPITYENIGDDEFVQKQILVIYWYIYQIYQIPKQGSFFQCIDFEKKINKFLQYYEIIDHRLSKNQLFGKLCDVFNSNQIPLLFNE